MAAEAVQPQVSISEATESEENDDKEATVTPTSAEEKSGVIPDTEEADTAIGSSQLLGVF